MATIKFWSEMTKATTVDGEDKVMIGRNATGEAMYADFQYLINQAGMNSSDYIPVDGNTLPDGGEGNKVTFAAPGTYTQSGGDDVVVPENSLGIITWDGDEWSLGSSVNIPEAEGVDYIDPEGEGIPKEKAVARWALNKYSERALPEGYEFIDLDRPDITDLSILSFLDEDMRIIPLFPGMDGSLFVTNEYDRPDLGLVFIDEDGYILFNLNSNEGSSIDKEEVRNLAKDEIKKSDFLPWYTDFGDQEGFNVNPGVTLEEFYGEWDDIMNSKINNPSYPDYISKELLGKSSMHDKDIWRYDFKPINPKVKVLLTCCTHGFEKNAAYMLRRFFSYFVDNWAKHPMTQWARHNVHFVVVPVLSPGAYVPNEVTGTTRGIRRVRETDPIPCSWTRTGSSITVEFEEEDFPDTDGRLSANNYFSHDGIEGILYISIMESSDEDALPVDGYRIETVNGARSVTVDAPSTSGASSGTCLMVVDTDPNRNVTTLTPLWETFVGSGQMNGSIRSRHDNKGTRPFSLNETIIFRDLVEDIADETFIAHIDLHTGAGNFKTYTNPLHVEKLAPVLLAQELTSDFHSEPYEARVSNNISLPAYTSQHYDVAGYTAEWYSYADMDVQEATLQHMWFTNLILIVSRYYS